MAEVSPPPAELDPKHLEDIVNFVGMGWESLNFLKLNTSTLILLNQFLAYFPLSLL